MTKTINATEIKTIDVNAKEWFDRVNGNSYFSARVTVNLGMEDERTIAVPFQYGYGSQYEYSAFAALQSNGIIPVQDGHPIPWRYYQDNKIIARHNMQTNCLKKDVKAWGIL